MSEAKLFVDTNVVLFMMKGNTVARELLADHHIHISFVTEMELLCFPNISKSEESRIRSFIADCKVMDMTAEIKDLAIRIRRRFKLKMLDSIVAGTALYLDLPLVSADKAFEKVDGLATVSFQV